MIRVHQHPLLSRLGTIVLLAPLALLALSGCSGAAPTCAPGDGSCLRVLFIGNSYTYVNDLPGTLANLARAGGHTIQTDSLVAGGATLADHLADPATTPKLDSLMWNFVVLQEQSETPAVESWRESTMYPAVRTLVAMVRQRDETPILFMTWAHRDGLPDNGLPDYESMQQSIDRGYVSIAAELLAPVAPVGVTWFVVRRQNPDIDLWQDDGSHPSTAGTYLAACVFYAALFRQSPEGLGFTDGLSTDAASVLQKAAAGTVLPNPAQWWLPQTG